VADVKDYAPLLGRKNGGIHAPIDQLPAAAAVAVSENVTRTELAGHQFRQRPLRVNPTAVHHYGDLGDLARLNRLIERPPFRSGVVRCLDPNNYRLIL